MELIKNIVMHILGTFVFVGLAIIGIVAMLVHVLIYFILPVMLFFYLMKECGQ